MSSGTKSSEPIRSARSHMTGMSRSFARRPPPGSLGSMLRWGFVGALALAATACDRDIEIIDSTGGGGEVGDGAAAPTGGNDGMGGAGGGGAPPVPRTIEVDLRSAGGLVLVNEA